MSLYFCCYDTCDKTFVDKIDLEEHFQNHHREASYFCHQCGEFSASFKKLQKHYKIVHGDKIKAVSKPCKFCGKPISGISALKLHFSRIHSYTLDENHVSNFYPTQNECSERLEELEMNPKKNTINVQQWLRFHSPENISENIGIQETSSNMTILENFASFDNLDGSSLIAVLDIIVSLFRSIGKEQLRIDEIKHFFKILVKKGCFVKKKENYFFCFSIRRKIFLMDSGGNTFLGPWPIVFEDQSIIEAYETILNSDILKLLDNHYLNGCDATDRQIILNQWSSQRFEKLSIKGISIEKQNKLFSEITLKRFLSLTPLSLPYFQNLFQVFENQDLFWISKMSIEEKKSIINILANCQDDDDEVFVSVFEYYKKLYPAKLQKFNPQFKFNSYFNNSAYTEELQEYKKGSKYIFRRLMHWVSFF